MNERDKGIHNDLQVICYYIIMLCPNCAKLAALKTSKTCLRCQGPVFVNISVLCDNCSSGAKQCSVCLKTIVSEAERAANRGCNCGKK